MRYTTERFGETTNLLGQFTAARAPADTFAPGDVSIGNDTIAVAPHVYEDGDGPHTFTSSGALPTGIVAGTDYWLREFAAGQYTLHPTRADALAGTNTVNITSTGSGTHTISSAVQMTLIDLETDTEVVIDDGDTDELTTTTRGGFSTYKWSTDKITSPATEQTEYEYLMEDRYTGATHTGKVIVGGFPDQSAQDRYQGAVHQGAAVFSLPSVALQTGETLTFATGVNDTLTTTGDWEADGFVVGRRCFIINSANGNNGVTEPVLSVTPTVLTFDGPAFHNRTFAAEGPSAGHSVAQKVYEFPFGTFAEPVGTILDAEFIALELGLNTFRLSGGAGALVFFNVNGRDFIGRDQFQDFVEFQTGASHVGCRLERLTVFGPTLNGRLVCRDCVLNGIDLGDLTGVEGEFSNCALNGTIQIKGGGEFVGDQVASRSAATTTIDMGDAGSTSFLAGSVQGVFSFRNMNSGGDIVGMSLAGTLVSFEASCTAGQIFVAGYGEVTDGSVGPSVSDFVVKGSQIQLMRRELLNGLVGTSDIEIGNGTSDTWLERRYTWRSGAPTDINVYETYELFDQDGNPINGDHTNGNNPLFDQTRIIAARRRI